MASSLPVTARTRAAKYDVLENQLLIFLTASDYKTRASHLGVKVRRFPTTVFSCAVDCDNMMA